MPHVERQLAGLDGGRQFTAGDELVGERPGDAEELRDLGNAGGDPVANLYVADTSAELDHRAGRLVPQERRHRTRAGAVDHGQVRVHRPAASIFTDILPGPGGRARAR